MKIEESEIAKYLAGELNQEERQNVEDWIKKDISNRDKFLEIKLIWEFPEILRSSEAIDTEKARRAVTSKLPEFSRKINLAATFQKVAAVLFIPLLLSSLMYLYYTLPSSKIAPSDNEIDVSHGTVFHYTLSDGTKVWLNSGTHFEYPSKFCRRNRTVYLEGQAYFDVAKNRKPFIVRTSELNIIAKGTEFDVIAYPDDDRIISTLVEGRIDLYKTDPKAKSPFITTLSPDESATLLRGDGREIIIQQTDARGKTSWKDGKLVFENVPFEEIVRRLSKWYNTDIRLKDPELKSYRYTATFMDESLWQVLELLKNSAPVDYLYTDRSRNADGSFAKRQVDIYLVN